MSNAALERAKQLKAKKEVKTPKSIHGIRTRRPGGVVSSSKKTAVKSQSSRGNIPYAQIAKLYNDGKSMREISDQLKLTEPNKTTPLSKVNNALYQLAKKQGVTVDGKVIRISRGSKKAA